MIVYEKKKEGEDRKSKTLQPRNLVERMKMRKEEAIPLARFLLGKNFECFKLKHV